MTATYTKERELPAVRFTFELVNESAPLHEWDGVESRRVAPPRGGRAEKPESSSQKGYYYSSIWVCNGGTLGILEHRVDRPCVCYEVLCSSLPGYLG